MIPRNCTARRPSTTSIIETRLKARNAPASSSGPAVRRRRLNRPVANATTISTAKTTSVGAGWKRTAASRSTPTATAVSKAKIASASDPSITNANPAMISRLGGWR